ncbi:hypothetical protein [Novosphingobium sp.]|uniref:hypothetical protein n=1 Tax=Novosphingobium sp. TaxID=1874826 RepID=UPI003BAB2271
MSSLYWRARVAFNTGLSLSLAVITTLGPALDLPKIFRGDHVAFAKGAEMMLSVGSSLLGFIIAAVTLIYALTADKRFEVLRASASFSELAAASKAALFWLLIASVLGAILLMIEPHVFATAPRILIFVAVFVAVEVAVSTAALTWLISRLISL